MHLGRQLPEREGIRCQKPRHFRWLFCSFQADSHISPKVRGHQRQVRINLNKVLLSQEPIFIAFRSQVLFRIFKVQCGSANENLFRLLAKEKSKVFSKKKKQISESPTPSLRRERPDRVLYSRFSQILTASFWRTPRPDITFGCSWRWSDWASWQYPATRSVLLFRVGFKDSNHCTVIL